MPMGGLAHIESSIRRMVMADLPKDFLVLLDIQRYTTRAASITDKVSFAVAQTSLIELLERDLFVIEEGPHDQVPLTVRLQFLSSRLHLYSSPFFFKQSDSTSDGDEVIMQSFLYKGVDVAKDLIGRITENIHVSSSTTSGRMVGSESEGVSNMMAFFPKHYFRMAVMAGIFLLRVMTEDKNMSANDRALARSSIKRLHSTIMSLSQDHLDEWHRTASVLEILSIRTEDFPASHPDRNRSFRTIIEDGVAAAKTIRTSKGWTLGDRIPTALQFGEPANASQSPPLADYMPLSWDDCLFEFDQWFGEDSLLGGTRNSTDPSIMSSSQAGL